LRDLICSACGQVQPPETAGACPACSSPLTCRYDLAGLDRAAFPAGGSRSGSGVFRWSALLPVRDPALRLTLGEGDTPVVDLPRLGADAGFARLCVKDEAHQPLGSFKARGLAVALAAHVERGATSVTLPSAGNAAGAAAAYASVHGVGCKVVLPTAATQTFRLEARLAGARVVAVGGDLGVAGEWVKSHPGPPEEHVIATFREPFRVEGKKTLGFELWETFGDELPDVVCYPTGGGVGLVAMHLAFSQLREAGLLGGRAPKLIAAQSDGCAPVVRALASGADAVDEWEGSRRTLAEGLRVPKLAGGRLVLQALRETEGAAIAVSDARLLEVLRLAMSRDGVLLSAEGAVALAGLLDLRAQGTIAEGSRALFFNTASPYKNPETLAAAGVG
jgi:threonine synthase